MNEFEKVLLCTAIPVSVACHFLIRTYWIAVPVSGFSTVILIFLYSALRSENHRLDPLLILAVIFEGGFLGMLIAVVVGAPLALYRRWRTKRKV